MFDRLFNSNRVRDYYNKWFDRYQETYGDIIQAFRPEQNNELIIYLANAMKLQPSGHYLDAGCGVAGVSIKLSELFPDARFTGITISDLQAEQALKNINIQGLSQNISILREDFHNLCQHFPDNTFDGVFFLESLGHSPTPSKALLQAYRVCKPGGFIYIKDFYVRKTHNKALQRQIAKVIDRINNHYCYNVMDLNEITSFIRSLDIKLDFIKSFDFVDNISVRAQFEEKNGIKLFDSASEFMPADWYEIRFIKH